MSGVGKTALAHAIGTPLAKALNKRVHSFETPSDIRGTGRVGEISSRITEAFTKAKTLMKGDDVGIFIIDEADDLCSGPRNRFRRTMKTRPASMC